jgi:hypothetical protein
MVNGDWSRMDNYCKTDFGIRVNLELYSYIVLTDLGLLFNGTHIFHNASLFLFKVWFVLIGGWGGVMVRR